MRTRTRRSNSKTKQPAVACVKKLRSKIPRRRRPQISPVVFSSLNSTDQIRVSSSCLDFYGENSYDSSRVSAGADGVKSETRSRKREFAEIRNSGEKEFRRITRSYYKQEEGESKGAGVVEAEVSESSCVDSCSGAYAGMFGDRGLSLKNSVKGDENVKEIGRDEESDGITRSEISSVQHFHPETSINFGESSEQILKSGGKITENLPEFKGIEVFSITSGVDSPSAVKFQNACLSVGRVLSDKTIKCDENRGLATEVSEISLSYVESSFNAPNSESTAEQKPKFFATDPDLVCTEKFSYKDVSDHSLSPETTFSQLQWDSFPEISDIDNSDYTPSSYYDSGTEFSERSVGDSSQSPTFSLLLHYREQFSRSTAPFDTKVSSQIEDLCNNESTLLRFEEEEDEESYQCLRSRERKQVYLRDYSSEYCSNTDYGNLIVQQRLQMVHWIVEQSTRKELHKETLFLGVNLLDRFLSKGFFKSKKSLQIVGIACLTLATRIEENQPLNSVRQRTFYVGTNVYSRCEVVAMEWLVQEVLNFQCFLPSSYNFLWFYLKAAKASAEMEKTVKHLAVLAMLGHEQLSYWPSTVAASLVILVAVASNQHAASQRVMETHVRTKDDDLQDCKKSLQSLITYVL